MTSYLEFQVDKFLFKVAQDRVYSREGVWVKTEGKTVRIGISDFLQGRSGDVAFVENKPVGALVTEGEEITVIETIKVNISLAAPVSGKIIELNPAMETSPEVINQDPYGDGWLAVIEISETDITLKNLLEPQAYFDKIKLEAEQEVK